MGSFSLVHWVIIAGIVLLLFGTGRLSSVMGEFAKGIKAFRAGLREDEPPSTITHQTPAPPGTPQPEAAPVESERKAG